MERRGADHLRGLTPSGATPRRRARPTSWQLARPRQHFATFLATAAVRRSRAMYYKQQSMPLISSVRGPAGASERQASPPAMLTQMPESAQLARNIPAQVWSAAVLATCEALRLRARRRYDALAPASSTTPTCRDVSGDRCSQKIHRKCSISSVR